MTNEFENGSVAVIPNHDPDLIRQYIHQHASADIATHVETVIAQFESKLTEEGKDDWISVMRLTKHRINGSEDYNCLVFSCIAFESVTKELTEEEKKECLANAVVFKCGLWLVGDRITSIGVEGYTTNGYN